MSGEGALDQWSDPSLNGGDLLTPTARSQAGCHRPTRPIIGPVGLLLVELSAQIVHGRRESLGQPGKQLRKV